MNETYDYIVVGGGYAGCGKGGPLNIAAQRTNNPLCLAFIRAAACRNRETYREKT